MGNERNLGQSEFWVFSIDGWLNWAIDCMADSGGESSGELGGSVRYPEIDASPIMGSRRIGEMGGIVRYPDIVASPSKGAIEEPRRGLMVEYNKIFVAVGKDVKESKSTLIWALQNSRGKIICIILVHVPAQMIPMPSNVSNSLFDPLFDLIFFGGLGFDVGF